MVSERKFVILIEIETFTVLVNMLPYCFLSSALTVIKCSLILAFISGFFIACWFRVKGRQGGSIESPSLKNYAANIGQKQFFLGYIWIVESL